MYIFIAVLCLALLICLCIYIYRESTEYHVVSYEFSDKRLKKDKISFVFISDLHNKQYGKENCRLFEDIKKLSPEFVVLGGDMITSCMEKWSDYSDTVAFVRNLAECFPVYYSIGNHEERLERKPDKFPAGEYERLTAAFKKANAPIMTDESIVLPEYGIKLFSLNIDHPYYRKVITRRLPDDYITGKISSPDSGLYNILAVHNPEHFRQYAEWGADLVLSGHVHGGIVRLPLLGGVVSPALKLFPKYDGGLFSEGSSNMVLSRGIGSHTIPIRFNNRAEIILITLKRD